MTTEEKFNRAQEDVKTLTKRPSNDELLKLYALYKQGANGDVTGKRPNAFDFKGRAKFDFWREQKGKSKEEAMESYISLVQEMITKYS